MSIRTGTLYVDGKAVENTGSESICAYCRKAYDCKAFQDGFTLTVSYYGAPAQVKFKDLHMTGQIMGCPIGEFEYKKSVIVDGEKS
jgi:hypothetical protein